MKHLLQPLNSSLNFVNREMFIKDVLQYENNIVEVTVKRKRKDRTTPQNAYYWGVVIPIALQGFLDLGNDRDAKGNRIGTDYIHKYFKDEFLCYESEITLKTGEVVNKVLVGSTKDLNTTEFSDYIENVCRWCVENLDCVIPLPTKQNETKNKI